MSYTREELEEGFLLAVSEGDTEAANELAAAIEARFPEKEPEESLMEKSKNWFVENLDLPVGVASSLAGGIAGFSVGGPVGAAIGATAGGMLGTFGGSTASDYMQDEPIEWQEAFDKALISGGIDVVTLGIGSKIKPAMALARSVGMTPTEAAEHFVKEAAMDVGDKAASELTQLAAKQQAAAVAAEQGGFQAGTKESLQESQKIAEKAGGTLTVTQTGEAGPLRRAMESVANIGIFSAKNMANNTDRVSTAASQELQSLFGGRVSSYAAPDELAKAAFATVDTARRALSVIYANSMNTIAKDLGNKRVSVVPLKISMTKFMKSKKGEVFDELDPATKDLLQGYQVSLSKAKDNMMPAEELFRLDRMLNSKVSDLGGFGATAAQRRQAAELTQLQRNVRQTIQRTLERADPKAAADYLQVKKAYREGLNAVAPKMNASILNSASRGEFRQLGTLLAQGSHTATQIRAFMDSLDESYKTLSKLKGIKGERAVAVRKEQKELPFQTAEEAKQYVKEAYIRNLFPTLQSKEATQGTTSVFNLEEYSGLAKTFQIPDEAARMMAALGKDAPRVKQVMNLLAEASNNANSNLGSIMVRSKEYGALAQAAGYFTGMYTGGLAGAVAGVPILLTPIVMARASLNKGTVNRLLAFDKAKFASEEDKLLAANQLAVDIMSGAPSAVKEDLKEYIEKVQKDREAATRANLQQRAAEMLKTGP